MYQHIPNPVLQDQNLLYPESAFPGQKFFQQQVELSLIAHDECTIEEKAPAKQKELSSAQLPRVY